MRGPELYSIENEGLEARKPEHIERRLVNIEIENPRDRNESLRLARENIVENDDLMEAMAKATIEKYTGGSTAKLSHLENTFVAHLMDLSDDEIDSIIRQFNSRFKSYILKNESRLGIDRTLHSLIFENDDRVNKKARGNIHPEAIKNVIYFIRARKKILESAPEQK